MSYRPRTRRSFAHLAAWGLLGLAPLVAACGRDRSADATPPPPREDSRPATPAPAPAAPAAQLDPGAPAAAVTPGAAPAEAAAPADDPARLAERQRELDRRAAELDAREAALAAPRPEPRRSATRPAPGPAPAAASPSPRHAAPAPADQPEAAAEPGSEPEAAEPAPEPEAAAALPDDESWRRRPAADRPEPLRTVTLPADTRLEVELLGSVSSATAAAGDEVRARLRQPLVVDGAEVVPAGSEVVGTVTAAVPLGKVGGQARLVLDFRRLEPVGGEPAAIEAELSTKGENETARDAATIGGAAVGGAVLGRVLNRGNKGKGTLLGAIVGAAAGTVIASRSEGQEVVLPAGARLQLVLSRPVDVQVRSTPQR